MGISIHYNGKFHKNAVLSDMIEEVKEIAEAMKWKYQIFEEAFPKTQKENMEHDGKIYGICFTPPESETVFLSFLSNYRMSSDIHLKFFGDSENEQDKDLLYMLFTKTQFAGPAIHKAIIEIFRHLKKSNYFEEFNLMDEGQYWETGDEKLLEDKFKEVGGLIDSFALALETLPVEKGESIITYIERIAERVNENKKNRDS